MKKYTYFIIVFLILAGIVFSYNKYNQYATQKVNLVRVLDGDTVVVSNFLHQEIHVRLVGLDCCETTVINRAYKQAYEKKISIDEVIERGKESTDILNRFLAENKGQLVLKAQGLDKYNRTLGIIYAGKTNINDYMVEKGKCSIFLYNE
uniref:thermonuclease family protein n=1 Tax=Candidatus Stercorousia sp. TaxID=3048886 RepID=UPI0040258498